jgi:hypothetical protein
MLNPTEGEDVEYMLLIYGEEDRWDDASDDERNAMYAEYFKLSDDLRAKNALLSSNELQPVATATTVRVQNGETLVTDGPFAETKEVLGGYYLIEAESLDEAIEWAARIPAAQHGKIEVRPVVDNTARAEVSRSAEAPA